MAVNTFAVVLEFQFNTEFLFKRLDKNIKRMRWAGYGAIRNACKKNLEGRDHLENLGVDGRIILNWILDK
jgi:hypothetical protein